MSFSSIMRFTFSDDMPLEAQQVLEGKEISLREIPHFTYEISDEFSEESSFAQIKITCNKMRQLDPILRENFKELCLLKKDPYVRMLCYEVYPSAIRVQVTSGWHNKGLRIAHIKDLFNQIKESLEHLPT